MSQAQSPQDAPPWERFARWREETLGPAGRLMLQLAQVQPGHCVLDVGSGSGDTALLAAERVGPRGAVLATDVSLARMAGLSARGADLVARGILELRAARAEELDLPLGSFDAALAHVVAGGAAVIPGEVVVVATGLLI